MEELDLTGVERVLVVIAHPDDVDFGWAGSVAVMTDAGIEVVVLPRHRRRRGRCRDRHPARAEMAPLRRDEQRAAAAIVGVHDLHFLGYPDGRVEPTLELRRDITRVIRSVRPDRVMTQSPDRNWDRIYASHPDHLATGEAAVVRGVSRRAQPLGASRARGRRARAVDGRRALDGCRARRRDALRRHHDRGRPQDRGAAVAQEPAARSGRDRDDGAKLDRRDRAGGRAARGTRAPRR